MVDDNSQRSHALIYSSDNPISKAIIDRIIQAAWLYRDIEMTTSTARTGMPLAKP